MFKKIMYFIAFYFIALSSLQSQTNSFQYDSQNRLVKVDYGNGSIINYTYDANGNISNRVITGVSLPAAPTLTSPANNSTGNLLSLLFDWNDISGASSYHLQISNSVSFASILLDTGSLSTSQFNLTGNILNPLTIYYWRVNAVNIAGSGSFSSVFNFKTLGNPQTVTLLNPGNNSVNQPININFAWRKGIDQTSVLMVESMEVSKVKDSKSSENAIGKYWFETVTDTISFNNLIRDSTLTDTIRSVTNLTNNSIYYWRVKAKNEIGWGSFSTWFKFTTIVSAPVSPALALPLNGSINLSPALKLDWNTVPSASNYRIQIATDSLFFILKLDTTISVDSLNLTQGRLLYNQKYYWRVNASNVGGTSSYSPAWNFTTIQNLPLNLKVYLEGFWNGSTMTPDTISVYLAKSVTPFALIDSAKVIVGANGTAPLTFTKAINDNYYIVIKHRNHFETWSKLAQTFTTSISVNYDFTTAANKAYGDNLKQIGLVWVLYGGDANYDGSIDGQDVPIFINQFGTQGYLVCDFNGDGDVNGSDVSVIISNFGSTKVTPLQSSVTDEKFYKKDYDIENKRKDILNKISKPIETKRKIQK